MEISYLADIIENNRPVKNAAFEDGKAAFEPALAEI